MLFCCKIQGEDGDEGKKTGRLWKGLSSKIFGGDTPEARDTKLKSLETQVEEGESSLLTAQEELRLILVILITRLVRM